MALSEAMLPEFDHEMANTRRSLERMPEDRLAWKPHEKSATMGWLVTHLANIPSWVTFTLDQDSLDLAPPGGGSVGPIPPANSRNEVLEMFDKNVTAARGHRGGQRRPPRKILDAAFWWEGDIHAASDRRASQLSDEPQYSPPRPAWGLSAAE